MPSKPDRRWALRGRIIIIAGLTLMIPGLVGWTIFRGAAVGSLCELVMLLGCPLMLAGLAVMKRDREKWKATLPSPLDLSHSGGGPDIL